MSIDLSELQKRINDLLADAEVFDLAGIGWLDEEETDPEQIGYAMWEQDEAAGSAGGPKPGRISFTPKLAGQLPRR